MANVIFKVGTSEQFKALESKSDVTLYWLSDTQQLYKGDVLYGTGALASKNAAGLLSAEDYVELKALIAAGPASGALTAADKSIAISGGMIGVQLSSVEGQILSLQDDGLYATVDSIEISNVSGLEDRLSSVEETVSTTMSWGEL